MKRFKEVSLEELASSLSDALELVKAEIKNGKSNGVGCIMFIHGYGSSGKGGTIRIKAREWLNAQLKKSVVKSVILGEDFNIFNPSALTLKKKYKQLEQLIFAANHGVTVVEL